MYVFDRFSFGVVLSWVQQLCDVVRSIVLIEVPERCRLKTPVQLGKRDPDRLLVYEGNRPRLW